MFNATPKLRDLLDVRTVVLVAVIALGAFGLQLAFVAGTVASPLGGAIADFDRVPQGEGTTAEAVAQHDVGGERPVRDVVLGARLQWQWPTDTDANACTRSPACLVYP